MADPGLYRIRFQGDGHAAIFSRNGERVEDLRFVAKADQKAVFIFELEDLDPPPVRRFLDPPVAWIDQPAPESKVERESDVRLTITVFPHSQLKEESYPFQIRDIVIWPSGDPERHDPTIVEKPPDP
jgi:hypothetical protein